MLSGGSSDLFMRYFKTYLKQRFTGYAAYAAPGAAAFVSIPEDFVINHYVSGFAEAVKWWAGSAMKAAPEKVVEYYMALNQSFTRFWIIFDTSSTLFCPWKKASAS